MATRTQVAKARHAARLKSTRTGVRRARVRTVNAAKRF